MTIDELARAFVQGKTKGRVHNAEIVQDDDDGVTHYRLWSTNIATREPSGRIWGNWGGYYTPTTANHLNSIIHAAGGQRVGYAQARKDGIRQFIIKNVKAQPNLTGLGRP